MKLKDLMIIASKKCKENNLEIEAVKKLLIELKYQSAANFILGYNDDLDNELIEKVNMYLDDLIPIQYILGYTYFYGLKIFVNRDVLIPRSDTEVLVEEAIKEINKNSFSKCLDLCTGSGAIGLAIKANTKCDVYGSDISILALNVANDNKQALGLDVNYVKSDILENIDYQFDIILSNPPYIGYNDDVEKIVYKNEPHLALFAEEEGLYFYKKILEEIKLKQHHIKMVIFEIGYKQAGKIIDIANLLFENITCEVIKDHAHLDRVLKISFNNK